VTKNVVVYSDTEIGRHEVVTLDAGFGSEVEHLVDGSR